MKLIKRNIEVPLGKLKPSIKNPRKGMYDENDLQLLADNLNSLGQINNIKVYADGSFFIILAGHRRYMAAQMLKWDCLKADIYGELTELEVSSVMLSDNLTQKRFSAWDAREAISDIYWNEFCEVYAFKSDKDRGYQEFGKMIGLSGVWVKKIIDSLSKKNLRIAKRLKDAKLGVKAVDIITKSPKKYQDSLVNFAIKNKRKFRGRMSQDAIRDEIFRLSLEDIRNEDVLPPSFVSRVEQSMNNIIKTLSPVLISKLDINDKIRLKKGLKEVSLIMKRL